MNTVMLAAVLIPPAAGALIGYVTNKIAILMLFRPHREKYFLGIRIPMTPGIIPRQRYELSRSIARQVAKELFTVEAVITQMESEGFLEGLNNAVRRTGDEWQRIPVRSLLAGFNSSQGVLPVVLREIGLSRGFHELVNATVRTFLESFTGDCSGDDPQESGFFLRRINRGCTLGELFSPGLRSVLVAAIEGTFPFLRELILQWLNRPSTHKELHRRGILLMRDAVGSLNSFQRLVVIAGQYDRTMEDRMAYLVDRFILSLRESIESPKTADSLTSTFEEYLHRNRNRPLKELFSPENSRDFSRIFNSILEKTDLLGGLMDFNLDKVMTLIPQQLTVGEILQWESGGSEHLTPVIAATVGDLVKKAVPAALEVMDIEKLVVKRIDSLAIEQVESLLLEVIEKQLKWINFFGALLGSVIGGVQVLLYFFGI